MKILRKMVAVFSVLAGLFFMLFYSAAAMGRPSTFTKASSFAFQASKDRLVGKQGAAPASSDVPSFKGHEKVDLTMGRKWKAAMAEGDLAKETPCIVKLSKKADKGLQTKLKGAGLKVKTVLKTIVTGKIEVGNIPALVALDEVIAVEAGKPVGLK